MGRLVVIEGLDGAGKRTLADKLTTAWQERGATVAGMAFPRYGHSVYAELVSEGLHGQHGDLGESVYGMGLLYALDRRAAAGHIRELLAAHDYVLLDRYVASNAAYQAARLGEDADGPVVRWVRQLEIERFELPVPDVQLLLSVPAEVAGGRAESRAREDSTRARDAFESDGGLQRRCARMYEQLAARDWLCPWYTVDGSAEVDARAVFDALSDRLGQSV